MELKISLRLSLGSGCGLPRNAAWAAMSEAWQRGKTILPEVEGFRDAIPQPRKAPHLRNGIRCISLPLYPFCLRATGPDFFPKSIYLQAAFMFGKEAEMSWQFPSNERDIGLYAPRAGRMSCQLSLSSLSRRLLVPSPLPRGSLVCGEGRSRQRLSI